MKEETFKSVLKSMILERAEGYLEMDLTEEDIENIYDDCMENMDWFLIVRIEEFADKKDLLKRNVGAENSLPHYKVIHKNDNAFQHEFNQVGFFKTEEDAKRYIGTTYHWPDDYSKIIMIDNDGEKEIFEKHHQL